MIYNMICKQILKKCIINHDAGISISIFHGWSNKGLGISYCIHTFLNSDSFANIFNKPGGSLCYKGKTV